MSLLGNLKSFFGSKVNIGRRFELLREAITGTMSNFYMARDRESGEIVGLKILDPEKSAAYEARFKGLKKPSEGEIGMALNHPNIMKTLEYGMSTDGQQYVVVEYLDGPGLHSLIVAKEPTARRQPRQAAPPGRRGAEMVHDSGYIHHDVCPRNFVCTKDLQSLKLIDFGLTVPLAAEYMQPGNRTGTANYMAPEVVRRRNEGPSARHLFVRRNGLRGLHVLAPLGKRNRRTGAASRSIGRYRGSAADDQSEVRRRDHPLPNPRPRQAAPTVR